MADLLLNEPWLKWAIEIQSLAQNGLAYSENVYDLERYQRLRDIAAEMMSCKTALPLDTVKGLFCHESGYQTPKIDTRAAVFQHGKILLVQEHGGLWTLPGGWVDVTETLKTNTVKEVWEEAGLTVNPLFIIAVHHQHKRNFPPFAYPVLKTFVHCENLGGHFRPNSETLAAAYFDLAALPPLDNAKTTAAQIELCFQAADAPHWITQFD